MSNPKPKEFLAGSYLWVDVRDAALAHVLALEKPEAGGERIIVSAASYVWQEWRTYPSYSRLHSLFGLLSPIVFLHFKVDAISTLPPDLLPSHRDKWHRGFPEICDNKVYIITVNGKQEKILGIKYRNTEETVRDTLVEFASRGW